MNDFQIQTINRWIDKIKIDQLWQQPVISSSCFQVRYLICDLFNHHVLIAPTCVCWCVRGTRTLCGASCSRRRPLWGGPWPFKRRRSLLSWRTGGGGLKLSGTEISLSPLSLYTFTSVYFRCLWFILMYPRWDETVEDCEDMKREEGEEEHVPPLPPPPSPSLRLSDIMFSLCPFVRHVLVIISPAENLITSLMSSRTRRRSDDSSYPEGQRSKSLWHHHVL